MKTSFPIGLVLWCVSTGTSAGAAELAPALPAAGYAARRLSLPPDVLPSCMTVRDDGTLAVGSMDGDIALVSDADGDGTLDRYTRWAGTLPHWPLGLHAEGEDLLVATRGALLRLGDRDRDGWAERWSIVSDEWDVSRDHHDWTTGIARLPDGGWVVCPVTDDVRSKDITGRHHFRGKALRVAPDGTTRVLAEGLRYPTGWATRRKDGAIFFSDNQGQQKTTCEIDRLVPGGWYGYASQADPPSSRGRAVVPPAVRIPYPWARSVNGLAFVDAGGRFGPLDGQLILCEYNNRFLLRASLEDVDGQTQGACYPFLENLLGPICLAFSPAGDLYVGSLREPAWGGAPEQGAVFRVSYAGLPDFGIREMKARPDGFALTFFAPPADPSAATDPRQYRLRRYRHVFRGSYHSPPTDEQNLSIEAATLEPDGKTVRLRVGGPMIPDRIYELQTHLADAHPAVAHYTMNRVPRPEGEPRPSPVEPTHARAR